jgi:transcriptional regulator with XRE-family HTH domain
MKSSNPVDRVVGSQVAVRRQSIGLSVEALAARLGVDIEQMRRYETGDERLSAEQLRLVANILDVPVSHFMPRSPLDLA